MNRCPKCQAILPDAATWCQFCNTDFAPVQAGTRAPEPMVRLPSTGAPAPTVRLPFRPPAGPPPLPASIPPAAARRSGGWEQKGYYIIATWWAVTGLYTLAIGCRPSAHGFLTGAIVSGLITATIGIGLLLRVEVIRGLVNLFCFVQIAFCVLGLALMLLFGSFSLVAGVLGVIFNFIQIAVAGLMIYLIGETETRGPSF